jgi:hypothetical protein
MGLNSQIYSIYLNGIKKLVIIITKNSLVAIKLGYLLVKATKIRGLFSQILQI